MLDQPGIPPVLTFGTATPTPTRIKWNGELLLTLYQQNGVFELMVENGRAIFWSDTPGVKLEIKSKSLTSDGSLYDLPLR
jgi:hypothetical protein